MFQEHGIAKDSQLKSIKKLFDEWNGLKKLAKDVKKEISPLVHNENEKNLACIKKLEDDLKNFQNEMKRREFFFYKTGVEGAKEKLAQVSEEIKGFEEKIEDYGYNALKFGSPDIMQNSIRQVEAIKLEVANMNTLWDHTDKCLNLFQGYMDSKWVETSPFDMEEEVKTNSKQLKEMKVDKKCNAYLGI